jgi:hypothetical protein
VNRNAAVKRSKIAAGSINSPPLAWNLGFEAISIDTMRIHCSNIRVAYPVFGAQEFLNCVESITPAAII